MNTDDYEKELDLCESNFSPWLREKTTLIASMLEGKKVLEVGCGTGNLIKFLSNSKFDLTGSDFSDIYLNKARKKIPHVKFFKANLLHKESWENFKNSFDSIIASEVVEHIEDDVTALKTIHSLLKPGGILVLDVPCFNLLYSEFDKKIGHFKRYSRKSISNVVEKSGFRIEKTRYWNLLGLFGWLITFKILKKGFEATKKIPAGLILGKWLKLESKIPMPIGLTIFVKARKIENET